MHCGQVFCNLAKYLRTNFQVKWSENEGGVAIWRLFFQKSTKNSVLTRILKKNNLPIAIPSFSDHFTWNIAQKYFLTLQKTWPECILLFLLFIAHQNSKNSENGHFGQKSAILKEKRQYLRKKSKIQKSFSYNL